MKSIPQRVNQCQINSAPVYVCINLLLVNFICPHYLCIFNRIHYGRRMESAQKKHEKWKLKKLDEELELVTCGASTTKKRRLVPQKAQCDLMTCGPPATNNISGDSVNFCNSLLNSWTAFTWLTGLPSKTLKTDAVVKLLKNFNPMKGLLNDTRLIIIECHKTNY